MKKTLTEYANFKNWSNLGFEGERNTQWKGPGVSGPSLAVKALALAKKAEELE